MGRMDDFNTSSGERIATGSSASTETSGWWGHLTCHFDKEGARVATTGMLASLMAHGSVWDGSDGLLGDDRGCPLLSRCLSCPKDKDYDDTKSAATTGNPGVSGEALVRQTQLDDSIRNGFL
jgi:hypothetical protein